MKRTRALAFLLLPCLTVACATGPLPSEAPMMPTTASADVLAPSTPCASPSSPEPSAPTPIGQDGPSVFDASDITEVFADTSTRTYDPRKSVPPSDDPYKHGVEAEAIELGDRFFETICRSFSAAHEADLSPFYDASTDVRRWDRDFNQAYLYGEWYMRDDVTATYDGSTYAFNWSEWSDAADNGVLLMHTKTGITYAHDAGEVTRSGGKDFRTYTDEFAFTRIDGALKVIRYRHFSFNYGALQRRLIDNPHLIDDPPAFRRYIEDVLAA